MNTISMKHLSRDYGEGKGIFDISFHVKQGEVFGFLGPNGAGKTILMSSHIFEEVERTCDRIGIIRKGKMVAVDSASALRERHICTYTVTLESESRSPGLCQGFLAVCKTERQVTRKAQTKVWKKIFYELLWR